jgi:putative membrane protein
MAEKVPDKSEPSTEMAAERTILAWIRTGLALMGFGFVVARFGLFLRELTELHQPGLSLPGNESYSLWTGVALVALGILVNLIAAIRYARIFARIRSGTTPIMPSHSGTSILALVLAIIGMVIAVYLLQIGLATR